VRAVRALHVGREQLCRRTRRLRLRRWHPFEFFRMFTDYQFSFDTSFTLLDPLRVRSSEFTPFALDFLIHTEYQYHQICKA
jgi:hypothetical protein